MTDGELLLAISDMFDKKLKSELQPIKVDIQIIKEEQARIKEEQTRINLMIENEIRPDIKLLSENYLPSAKRYEKSTAKLEAIQSDVDILKKVVSEHSERFQKLA